MCLERLRDPDVDTESLHPAAEWYFSHTNISRCLSKTLIWGKLLSSLRRIGLICSSISKTSWVKRNDWRSCEALSDGVSLLRGYKCSFSADEEFPVCGECLRVTDLHQPFTRGLNLCCCRRPLPHTFPHIETVVSLFLSRRQAVKLKSRLLYLGIIHLSIQT